MKKDFGPKAFLEPMPVLIIGTYDKEGKPNAMNAAYGGMVASQPPVLNVYISEAHKTHENLRDGSAFTIHLGTKDTVVASDYVGLTSANNGDKMAKTGWTIRKSDFVDAPVFEEFPLVIECKVAGIEGTRVLGEIVNVAVEEACLDENGDPDLGKMGILAFDGTKSVYRLVGDVVAGAFAAGKELL